jgi:hypothetical protein
MKLMMALSAAVIAAAIGFGMGLRVANFSLPGSPAADMGGAVEISSGPYEPGTSQAH